MLAYAFSGTQQMQIILSPIPKKSQRHRSICLQVLISSRIQNLVQYMIFHVIGFV